MPYIHKFLWLLIHTIFACQYNIGIRMWIACLISIQYLPACKTLVSRCQQRVNNTYNICLPVNSYSMCVPDNTYNICLPVRYLYQDVNSMFTYEKSTKQKVMEYRETSSRRLVYKHTSMRMKATQYM